MNLITTLVARCARVAPNKMHVALPLLIMAVLYWLSSLPGVPLSGDPALYAVFYWISPTLQNALHVPAYAALAGAWCWALRAWLHGTTAVAMVAGGISVGYGVLDEWHQSFVPGRYASMTDVLLDALGVGLALLALRQLRHAT